VTQTLNEGHIGSGKKAGLGGKKEGCFGTVPQLGKSEAAAFKALKKSV
jgi:hypothetical protein